MQTAAQEERGMERIKQHEQIQDNITEEFELLRCCKHLLWLRSMHFSASELTI